MIAKSNTMENEGTDKMLSSSMHMEKGISQSDEVPSSSSLWASRRAAFESPPASPPKTKMTPTSFSKSTAAELAEISRQGQKELKERQAQEAIQQEERERSSRWEKRTAAFQSGSTAAFVNQHTPHTQRRPLEQRSHPPHRSSSMGVQESNHVALEFAAYRGHEADHYRDDSAKPSDGSTQPKVENPTFLRSRGSKNIFVQNDNRSKGQIPQMFQSSVAKSVVAVGNVDETRVRKAEFGAQISTKDAFSSQVGSSSVHDTAESVQQLQLRLDSSLAARRSAEATAGDLARRLEDALGREDELVRQLTAANEEVQQSSNPRQLKFLKIQNEESQERIMRLQEQIKELQSANKKMEVEAQQRSLADASTTHSPNGRYDNQYTDILNGHVSSAKAARQEAQEANRRAAKAIDDAARSKEAVELRASKMVHEAQVEVGES